MANVPDTRYFHAHTQISDSYSISAFGTSAIFCMKLSPDGRFLATGSDAGTLEIHAFQMANWQRVRLYETGAPIRTLTWHPRQQATVFVGSANGRVHKITVVLHGVRDDIVCTDMLPGFIHLLEISADGRNLAVAYGHLISIVQDPFPHRDHLGTLANLEVQVVDHGQVQSFIDYYIPRGIFFLLDRDNTVLVTFFGQRGIIAYSVSGLRAVWSIPLRFNSFVGSAALSPSREVLAVMNLRDGIDFYSTITRRFVCTTKYQIFSTSTQPPRNPIVGIVFMDDHTVAVGHSDGYIAIATFNVASLTGIFRINGNRDKVPIQTVAFGVTEGLPCIFGAIPAPMTLRQMGQNSEIHVGRIDPILPDRTNRTMDRARNRSVMPLSVEPFPVTYWAWIFGLTMLAILLSFGFKSSKPSVSRPLSTSIQANVQPAGPPPVAHVRPPPVSSACVCTITGTVTAVFAKESGVY